ncbi:hypothetical protein [Tenacibaculum maritimum]|uniref:hypothetical protein n=1 Tax=Tenacibaculum maritimum TaxID=107401 RepID=UPI003876C4CB
MRQKIIPALTGIAFFVVIATSVLLFFTDINSKTLINTQGVSVIAMVFVILLDLNEESL